MCPTRPLHLSHSSWTLRLVRRLEIHLCSYGLRRLEIYLCSSSLRRLELYLCSYSLKRLEIYLCSYSCSPSYSDRKWAADHLEPQPSIIRCPATYITVRALLSTAWDKALVSLPLFPHSLRSGLCRDCTGKRSSGEKLHHIIRSSSHNYRPFITEGSDFVSRRAANNWVDCHSTSIYLSHLIRVVDNTKTAVSLSVLLVCQIYATGVSDCQTERYQKI